MRGRRSAADHINIKSENPCVSGLRDFAATIPCLVAMPAPGARVYNPQQLRQSETVAKYLGAPQPWVLLRLTEPCPAGGRGRAVVAMIALRPLPPPAQRRAAASFVRQRISHPPAPGESGSGPPPSKGFVRCGRSAFAERLDCGDFSAAFSHNHGLKIRLQNLLNRYGQLLVPNQDEVPGKKSP